MNLTFVNPGMDYMIQSIMAFQSDEETSFWTEPLYHFYPQLDKEHAQKLTLPERRKYIKFVMQETYADLEETMNQKLTAYISHWEKYRTQIVSALSEAFELDCDTRFHEMRCYISMNPVSPRFLQEEYFEVFYLNSERGALGTAIHEIIHIVWFYVWNQIFGDSYEEYERPSMKWILSEMVVEPIMRDERLSSINPYFPRENGGCVYPYFYDMLVDGKPILETLDEMYRSQNIRKFMKNSYQYCLEHEAEIRKHIEESERGK